MNELIREEELKKSGLSAAELLLKFKEQLLRDFEMSNVDEHLDPLGDSFDAIQKNILQVLDKISGVKLQTLLYRIDISEKQLNESLKEFPEKTRNDVVSVLIIKRILQKIILKVIYSK
jgi:hypothetical protein